MDRGPLVSELIEEGASLASRFDRVRPLKAAFWLNDAEGGGWYLYLVSDQVVVGDVRSAYGDVLDILGPGPHLWLDPFQVKVTGPDDPVSRAVIATQSEIERKRPGRGAIRLRNRRFGGVYAEETYIYPIPVPSPSA